MLCGWHCPSDRTQLHRQCGLLPVFSFLLQNWNLGDICAMKLIWRSWFHHTKGVGEQPANYRKASIKFAYSHGSDISPKERNVPSFLLHCTDPCMLNLWRISVKIRSYYEVVFYCQFAIIMMFCVVMFMVFLLVAIQWIQKLVNQKIITVQIGLAHIMVPAN